MQLTPDEESGKPSWTVEFILDATDELNKLKDTRKRFNLSKVKKLGKLGRRLPGAAGIALLAIDLLSGD